MFEVKQSEIATGLNMTAGCMFFESDRQQQKEVKLLIEDRTTRKLREIKLVK